MSAWDQKRKSRPCGARSALPPSTDIVRLSQHVRKVPFSDLGGRNRDVWFTPMSGHRQRDRLRQKSAITGSQLISRSLCRCILAIRPRRPLVSLACFTAAILLSLRGYLNLRQSVIVGAL